MIGLFTLTVGFLVFVYEKPTKSKHKLTGRGGDFES